MVLQALKSVSKQNGRNILIILFINLNDKIFEGHEIIKKIMRRENFFVKNSLTKIPILLGE